LFLSKTNVTDTDLDASSVIGRLASHFSILVFIEFDTSKVCSVEILIARFSDLVSAKMQAVIAVTCYVTGT